MMSRFAQLDFVHLHHEIQPDYDAHKLIIDYH